MRQGSYSRDASGRVQVRDPLKSAPPTSTEMERIKPAVTDRLHGYLGDNFFFNFVYTGTFSK